MEEWKDCQVDQEELEAFILDRSIFLCFIFFFGFFLRSVISI